MVKVPSASPSHSVGNRGQFPRITTLGVSALAKLRGEDGAVDEYRRYAAECISGAQQSPDPVDKAILLRHCTEVARAAHKLEAEASGGGNR